MPDATAPMMALMQLHHWIDEHGGIVHRDAATAAGFARAAQRHAVAEGRARGIRRSWLATGAAPLDLVTAAQNTGRVTCSSLAKRRGWWLPDRPESGIHLSFAPHAASPVTDVVAHWGASIAPAPVRSLEASTEDALAHIAVCLAREEAIVLWESAIRIEGLSVDALRRVRWPAVAARECAEAVNGLSDSGLETIVVQRLSPWGVPMRQQAIVAGHRVDLLIGDRLVVQIDGFSHHSTSAQRSRDVAVDAELVLRGYTVLRFTYSQVLYDWPGVERVIARAMAAGAHRVA